MDLNKLHSLALKASLRGDEAEHKRIMDQIAQLSAPVRLTPAGGNGSGPEQGRGDPRGGSKQPVTLAPTRDALVKSSVALGGLPEATVDRILQAERLDRTSNASDKALADSIISNKRFANDADLDEYDELGPVRDKKKKVKTFAQQQNADRSAQMAAAAKERRQADSCHFCFSSPKMRMNLAIAVGARAYLSLPSTAPLVPGHCLISTIEHETASVRVDDETWDELRNFKKCLAQLFAHQGRSVVFLETVTPLKQKRHLTIECLPLTKAQAADAPLFFKREIDEQGAQWASHKKIIDTRGKDLRNCIPRQADFAYFHAEFSLGGGFATIVEEEDRFPKAFGRSVIAGILDIDADRYMYPKPLDQAVLDKMVAKFVKDFDPFDWTKMLAGQK